MSREDRSLFESLQVEEQVLRERLAALEPELAQAEHEALVAEDHQRDLEDALRELLREHQSLVRETRRLEDNLPTQAAQDGAERTATLFAAGAFSALLVVALLVRCG